MYYIYMLYMLCITYILHYICINNVMYKVMYLMEGRSIFFKSRELKLEESPNSPICTVNWKQL